MLRSITPCLATYFKYLRMIHVNMEESLLLRRYLSQKPPPLQLHWLAIDGADICDLRLKAHGYPGSL